MKKSSVLSAEACVALTLQLRQVVQMCFYSVSADTSSVCSLRRVSIHHCFGHLCSFSSPAQRLLCFTEVCDCSQLAAAARCCYLQRPVFKNVFVVESEKLRVDACAAVEAHWPADQVGATGEGSGQN